MKVVVQASAGQRVEPAPGVTLGHQVPVRAEVKSLAAVFCDLVKIRLTSLVLLTTLVGFYAGTQEGVEYGLLIRALIGTALVACGASALNQLWEREHDAKMRRTEDRPLPSGRLQPETVLMFGVGCSLLGLVLLVLGVNLLTASLGALTLGVYIFVYTPLKRVTWLNTMVGAIPGALPPLIGWAAARDQLNPGGVALFGIIFFWQIAHFLAIAWMYREEYAMAGFVMLPTVDPSGVRTGCVALGHSIGLLFVSLFPVVLGLAGPMYLGGATVLGVGFAWCTFQFARKLTVQDARQAFYASIIYLPMLLTLLVLDKVKG